MRKSLRSRVEYPIDSSLARLRSSTERTALENTVRLAVFNALCAATGVLCVAACWVCCVKCDASLRATLESEKRVLQLRVADAEERDAKIRRALDAVNKKR